MGVGQTANIDGPHSALRVTPKFITAIPSYLRTISRRWLGIRIEQRNAPAQL